MHPRQPSKKSTVKVACYFTEKELEDLGHHGRRLRRSRSWLVRRAWALAHAEIEKIPDVPR